MFCYQELYGSDADGNRGIYAINAEINEDDYDDIRAQLEMLYEPGTSDYTVILYCHQFDSHHEFEVDINDYFTPIELKGMT